MLGWKTEGHAMGFLDAICEGSFVRKPDGRTLFFPWGALGRGYLIPSEERCRRMRRECKILFVVNLCTLPILVVPFYERVGLLPFAGAALVLVGFAVLRLALMTRGLVPTAERITRREGIGRTLQALRTGRSDGSETR
jgi:peptidoglycan/LPS O-acetylase OafA/YrhL